MAEIKVEFHSKARKELLEASLYYERLLEHLGDDFLQKVYADIELIYEHPQIGSPFPLPFRRIIVDHFPYAIIYKHEKDQDDEIIFILAIMHLSRNPDYWKDRI